MSYNAKNYTEQGGDVTHIGGKLKFESGAAVEGFPSSAVPTASATEKGTVKIGKGINVATDGTISSKLSFCFVYGNNTKENEFESGMTWAEFVTSSYNSGPSPLKFSIDEDNNVSFISGTLYPKNPITGSGKIPGTQKMFPIIYSQYTE